MTDERMTQGDVRLREEEVCDLRDALVSSGCIDAEDWVRFVASEVRPVVERIVAARVGEVVERVEAVAHLGTSGRWIITQEDLEAALRAADAPLSDVERDGGRGGVGGDEAL